MISEIAQVDPDDEEANTKNSNHIEKRLSSLTPSNKPGERDAPLLFPHTDDIQKKKKVVHKVRVKSFTHM